MFLRIAVMDAKMLQKIVDMVQRPELHRDEDQPDNESGPVHSGATEEPTAASASGAASIESADGAEGATLLRVKKSVRINDRPLPAPRVDVRGKHVSVQLVS